MQRTFLTFERDSESQARSCRPPSLDAVVAVIVAGHGSEGIWCEDLTEHPGAQPVIAVMSPGGDCLTRFRRRLDEAARLMALRVQELLQRAETG